METDSGWVYLRVGCISLWQTRMDFIFHECARMCVSVRVCVHVCVCLCMFVCMYVCVCVCVCESEFLVRGTAVSSFPIFKPVVRPVAGVVPVACGHFYI